VLSGWFCGTVPSVSRFSELEVLLPGAAGWTALSIPSSIKALVFVNLQSYGGGRNIWGEHVSSKKEFKQPALDDGLIEVQQ
jgi:diacylglycerol kinase (ATP)